MGPDPKSTQWPSKNSVMSSGSEDLEKHKKLMFINKLKFQSRTSSSMGEGYVEEEQ